MRYSLMLLAWLVAGVCFAQEGLPTPFPEWNPHHGLEKLFLTEWDHRGGTRYPIPQEILDTIRTIQWTNATSGNLDRPSISSVLPVLVDARNPSKRESWRIFELEQFTFEPLDSRVAAKMKGFVARDLITGQPYRIVRARTPALSTDRILIPPVHDMDGNLVKPGSYSTLFDVSDWPNRIRIAPRMSQINFVTLGSDQLVVGNGKIELGKALTVRLTPKAMQLEVGGDLVVTKDGAKYLRVSHRGKKYGLLLEPLE